MRTVWKTLISTAFFCVTGLAAAGNALFPISILSQNQSLTSTAGKYSLWMQTDGNLVIYRSDGTARWATNVPGLYAIMQGDGNFVVVGSANEAVFNTRTYGNPGAYIAIQDDGNLVVYASGGGGIALWSIGPDNDADDPRATGDVVGRDLASDPLGPAGHVAIADGSVVYQATNYSKNPDNKVETISLSEYKGTSRYWGAASPNIPSGEVDHQCYLTRCNTNDDNLVYVEARIAIVYRALQIILLGADYSIFLPDYQPSLAARDSLPRVRGVYRCDTFVLDAYNQTGIWHFETFERRQWEQKLSDLNNTFPFLPTTVFDKLKSFE
jgi:hypothetical protein